MAKPHGVAGRDARSQLDVPVNGGQTALRVFREGGDQEQPSGPCRPWLSVSVNRKGRRGTDAKIRVESGSRCGRGDSRRRRGRGRRQGRGSDSVSVRFAKIDPALYRVGRRRRKFTPASLSNKQVTVVVQLGGAPVAVRDANAKKQGAKLTRARRTPSGSSCRSSRTRFTASSANARRTGRRPDQDAYNGIQVASPQKNLAQLASLPNVVAIHAVQIVQAGEHPRRAVRRRADGVAEHRRDGRAASRSPSIDTGIDYTHADFGGPGTIAAGLRATRIATVTRPTEPRPVRPERAEGEGRHRLRRRRLQRRRIPALASRIRTRTRSTATATARTRPARWPASASSNSGATYTGRTTRASHEPGELERVPGRGSEAQTSTRTACSAAPDRATSSTSRSTGPSRTAWTSSTCRSAPTSAAPTTRRRSRRRTP